MLAQTIAPQELSQVKSTTVETTLYDLIASIDDAASPASSELVTATVVHLLNSRRVRFSGDPRRLEVICC
ncbi:hypothetical protein NKDENANG_02428 [Candidatus Entotheonellaceae bacterium PAL068K]